MSTALPGVAPAAQGLRDAFLRWQCRVRQMAMRDNAGRPGDGMIPELTLAGDREPMGGIVTVLCRAPGHSATAELMHMARRTNDPAQRREAALRYFSAAYYQNARSFSDNLTATFPPGSPGAETIVAAGRCSLGFAAYSQGFDLDCAVRRLDRGHPLYQATWWHNLLFNPDLHRDTVILAFKPDWTTSSSSAAP